MFDFRKALTLGAILVAATGIASAQQPFTCNATATQVPIIRAEGLAEEVGQAKIICTGGQPTAVGQQIPKVNVQIFLGTNITSRLLATANQASEALLMIDPVQVQAAAYPRLVSAAPGNINQNALDSIGSTLSYNGAAGQYNVFQGQQFSNSSLLWSGVPLNAPGTSQREIRIVNVRANATQAPVSGSLIPSTISMLITITGAGAPALNNAVLTVASVQKGLTFAISGSKTFNQCEPMTDAKAFDLKFTENFPSAFRKNLATASQQQVIDPVLQYDTEAMFVDDLVNAQLAGTAGRASQGTRLMASFANVPAGVSVKVRDRSTTYVAGHQADLVATTDANGAGGTPSSSNALVEILSASATSRSAVAVWEVTDATFGAREDFNFEVFISYGSPLPTPGVATVTGNYAPVSTVGTASLTAPTPRFVVDPAAPSSTFEIINCQTNLLFPFIAFDGKFDTGIAISNTSKDPWGTPNQKGTCKIWFYGSTDSTDETTVEIAAGKQLVFTLSGGNTAAGIDPVGNFVGYAIARCNFQYAHGYAFISDVGADDLAQGYLALVLDKPLSDSVRRTGKLPTSESLNN